jgi:hypothetical protein
MARIDHTLSRSKAAMKVVISRAADVLSVTAELYRDMTLSALRLLPGRR